VLLKRHQSRSAWLMNSGPLPVADQLGSSTPAFDDLLEHLDGLVGAHPAGRWGGERFTGVLVGDGQDLERAAVGGAIADKVDCPDLIGTGRGQVAGHARSTPAPASLCG